MARQCEEPNCLLFLGFGLLGPTTGAEQTDVARTGAQKQKRAAAIDFALKAIAVMRVADDRGYRKIARHAAAAGFGIEIDRGAARHADFDAAAGDLQSSFSFRDAVEGYLDLTTGSACHYGILRAPHINGAA